MFMTQAFHVNWLGRRGWVWCTLTFYVLGLVTAVKYNIIEPIICSNIITNIRLGWMWLKVTKALAYSVTEKNYISFFAIWFVEGTDSDKL
jgi:hypothetical protein